MIAKLLVLGDVVDDDGSPAITNFVADRRLNVELAPRQEAEGNFVTNGASDPTITAGAATTNTPATPTSAQDDLTALNAAMGYVVVFAQPASGPPAGAYAAPATGSVTLSSGRPVAGSAAAVTIV